MSDFDAYAEWLQIPAAQRPPTHYDLLGLAPCESDTERIYQAAMERMGIVRRYHLGQHAKDALRLQTEISRALDCLRDPEQKSHYDERLLGQTIDDEFNATLNDALAGGAVSSASNVQPSDIGDLLGDATDPATGGGVRLSSRWRSATPEAQPAAVAFWKRPWFAISAVGLTAVFVGLMAILSLGPRPANVPDETMPSLLPTAMANVEQKADPPVSKLAPVPAPQQSSVPAVPPDMKPAADPPDRAEGVDLLSQFSLPAEAVAAGWLLDEGRLVVPETLASILPVPVELPDEYNLSLSVEPSSPSNALHLFLVVGGQSVVATIDGEQGAVSGLGRIARRPYNQNETTRGGHVLSTTGPSQLEFSVGRGNVRAACNGRTFLDWQGDAQEFSVGDEWGAAPPPSLALGATNGGYRLTSLRLLKKSTLPANKALAAGASLLTTQRASFTPVQLLAHAKPLEGQAGEPWAQIGSGIFTSPASSRAVLPIHYALPENYTLMTTIGARPKTAAPLAFGLVVAGNPVTLVIDGFGGWLSGLELVDGRELDRNETARGGRVISANKAAGLGPGRSFANSAILVTVVGSHIQASMDGRIFFDWEGDASRLSVPAAWQVPSDVSLWIGSAGGAYRIDRLVLIPHAAGGAPLASSPAMSPVPGVVPGSPFPLPVGPTGGREPNKGRENGIVPGGIANGGMPGGPAGGKGGSIAGDSSPLAPAIGSSKGKRPGRGQRVGPTSAARLPVPEAKELKLVESRVDKQSRAIRKDKTYYIQSRSIGTLIATASQALSEPAYAYALLIEARDLAAEIGDAHSALNAIDTLAQLFEVDIWELRLELFPRLAGPASKGPEGEYLVETILQYLDDAKSANQEVLVTKLIPQAQRAADRIRDKNIKKRVREKIAAIRKA